MQHRLFLLVLFIAAIFASCDDNPVKPKPTPSTYYFYGRDNVGEERVSRFDPSAGTFQKVADSFPPSPGSPVSADGRYLYICVTDSMVVYTTDSGRYVRTVPYPAVQAAASADNHWLALLGWSRLGLTLLGLPGYEVRFSDPSLNVAEGVFSHDSKTFYCLDNAYPDRQVLRLHLQDTISLERTAIPAMPGALIQVVPSVDEKLWFLYSNLGWDACAFGVYDVAGDSLIYLTGFSPGHGWLVVSPDGRNVFFTNAGTLAVGTPPPSAFYRYDTPTNSVQEISTRGLASDTALGDFFPIGPIAISPDGRTLVGLRSVIGNDLIVYDVPSRTITKYCNFNYEAMFRDINCQVGR